MDNLRACVLAVVLVTLSSCSSDDGENIFFEVSISDIAAYSATVTVKHNATNRDAYYGFVVKGPVSDVYAEIERFLRLSSEEEIQGAVHYQRKSVFQIKKLLPHTEFTFIVFGMDENGKLYGIPASIYFQTIGSTFTATINPNWIIEYMGHRVYNDNDYSLITVNLVGEIEERFFLATYLADFAEKFESTAEFIDYAVGEFLSQKDNENSEYWLEDNEVRTEGTNFYRYLTEGDYVAYAVGINADGTPTGHYVNTPRFHVEKYPAIENYAYLLDDWAIIDEEDKFYFVTFEESLVNESLIMKGWGNREQYSIYVTFDRTDASLKIASQIVEDYTEIAFSDGTLLKGKLSLRGAYYDQEEKLKCTNSNRTLAKANLNSDGSYALSSGFYVTFKDGTKTYETGILYYMERESESNAYFSCMMFPMVMKKLSSL